MAGLGVEVERRNVQGEKEVDRPLGDLQLFTPLYNPPPSLSVGTICDLLLTNKLWQR